VTAPSASGGRRRRKPATARRRDREVVETAARIFHERGYAEASVQDIADALGMLKGSLYYYIDTKEDLLFRVVEEVHDEVGLVLSEVSARDDLPPLELLRLYVARIVLYNTGNLVWMSVYYHEIDRLSEERRRRVLARRDEHETFVTGLIEAAQAAGDADPSADARLLRNFVFGSIIWIYRWYLPGGRVQPDVLAERCAEFVVRGVIGNRRGSLDSQPTVC
jgi:TetR/AcrR family transcriptional regulator, cholesterol catabolism regulator